MPYVIQSKYMEKVFYFNPEMFVWSKKFGDAYPYDNMADILDVIEDHKEKDKIMHKMHNVKWTYGYIYVDPLLAHKMRLKNNSFSEE